MGGAYETVVERVSDVWCCGGGGGEVIDGRDDTVCARARVLLAGEVLAGGTGEGRAGADAVGTGCVTGSWCDSWGGNTFVAASPCP